MPTVTALFIALPVTILTAAFIIMASKSRRPDLGEFKARSWQDNKLLWISTVGIAIVYLVAGLPKVGGLGGMVNQFAEWGYSADFMWAIGAMEMIGAVLLLFKRTAWWSASGLSIIAGGSVYTHLANGQFVVALFPLLIFAGLVYIAFERFPLREASADTGDALPA